MSIANAELNFPGFIVVEIAAQAQVGEHQPVGRLRNRREPFGRGQRTATARFEFPIGMTVPLALSERLSRRIQPEKEYAWQEPGFLIDTHEITAVRLERLAGCLCLLSLLSPEDQNRAWTLKLTSPFMPVLPRALAPSARSMSSKIRSRANRSIRAPV